MRASWIAGVFGLVLSYGCGSDGTPARDRVEELGRCEDFDELRQPFFGDTHVHTTLSLDANLQGTRLTPSDAYRYAQGEPVRIQPLDDNQEGTREIQIDRPLDFVVISDHAEFFGTIDVCGDPSTEGYQHIQCINYREKPDSAFVQLNVYTSAAPQRAVYPPLCGDAAEECIRAGADVWAEMQNDAEAVYDRSSACSFTPLLGYEWSAARPLAKNLHRNIIFRNGIVPERARSMFDNPYIEDVWANLRAECIDADTGCDALTIPHNSNLSSELMFAPNQRDTEPFDGGYVAERAFMEPLIEIFQHKGDSECLPGQTISDEFCGFEKMPYNDLATANLDTREEQNPSDFVRYALGEGLKHEKEFGANPFKYGMIASSDTHLAAPGAVDEENFPGHGGAGQPNRDFIPPGFKDIPFFNPGGLAAVWAEENSREAIFTAMRRRETFGTSGPRIMVRLFGGWDYPADMCTRADFAAVGYGSGVPMGGDLGSPPTGVSAPVFAIMAEPDPGTERRARVPLQRIQVVKGWLDGETHEVEVYEVGGGENDATVNPITCEAIDGTTEAPPCVRWVDPDFDPTRPAYYYVRVLENPTCRWTTYACLDGGVDCTIPSTITTGFDECCDGSVERTIQERAWTSPIWYTPTST